MTAFPHRVVRFAVLAYFAAMLPAVADAAGDWPVKRGPSHEPEPYRFDPALVKKLPREFIEDFPACTIYNGFTNLVEADGTVEKINHEVTRLSGRKGIERLGEYRNVTYDPSYETLTLNEARIFKASGKIVPIEPRHVQVRDVGTDFLVYDRDKQLVISFPNLEVGDIIEVKWTTRGKNPEHQGQFFTRYGFGDERYPVVVDEFRARLPKQRPLKYAATPGKLDPVIREDGDFRWYHWRQEKIAPLPQDENLPTKEELRVSLSCSTFGSWAEVGEWKKKLRKDCWTCTPEVKTVVAEVTRGLDKPLDKARALAYWVRRQVRYVSAGEKHDYTPHQPHEVLANRFGDCKDQSQLLAVMLREAGVPVALVTLGTLDDGQVLEAVPSPWGTHAIVLATIDGRDHWIDTTASMAGWDHLPRDDRDRACYIVDDKGLRLGRTPPLLPEQNRTVLHTKLKIAANGTSRSERHVEAYGSAAIVARNDWVEVPPGERRRSMAAELQNSQSKAHLVRLTLDDKKLRDYDQPASADIVYEVPGHFSGKESLDGSLTDSRVWSRLLSVNLDYDRKLPLDLGTPFESIHKYSIELSPILRFEDRPTPRMVRSPWGWFELKVNYDPAHPRRLEVEYHTRIEQTRVDPTDFDAFRKFHEDVFKAYRAWLSLVPGKAFDAKTVEAIEDHLKKTSRDVTSAYYLTRHYHITGKDTDARRVLKRALEQQPNELRLRQYAVELADTPAEEEAAYAALICLEPEEPRHAVGLAHRRLSRRDFAGTRKALAPVVKQIPKETPAEDGEPFHSQVQWFTEARYLLARCDLENGQPRAALAELEAAIRLLPICRVMNPDVALLKARIHERLDQAKEAIQEYRDVLDSASGRAWHSETAAPDDEALDGLLRLELAASRGADVVPYVRRYANSAGQSLNGMTRAADAYLRIGRDEEALELAQQARELDFHPETQRILGLVLVHRGDFQKGLFHLDRATPSSSVLEAIIDADLALGRLEDAVKQVDRIEALKDPSPTLRRKYALLLSLIQRRIELQQGIPPTKAAAWKDSLGCLVCAEHAWVTRRSSEPVKTILAGAFAAGAELGPAFGLRGQLALERGRLTAALADAERAVKLSPRESRGYYVRGRVRLERGQQGALADLSRAAELSRRKDAATLHWLAAALDRAGARAEALAAQREAAAIDPKDEEIREQLREFEKKQVTP